MSLELDRERRGTARPIAAETPDDPRDWYPKKKTDWRWLQDGLKRTATVIIVLLLLGIGWRVWKGQTLPGPLQSLVDGFKRYEGGEAVNEFDNGGIDCFTGDAGEYIAYTDANGTENIVESPAQVPAKYVKKARCIYMKGGEKKK